MTAEARRVRLDLAYDGTDFAGWQLQSSARTVQGTVEQALARIAGGERVRIRGAGRTDAGVHARGQVADVWLAVRLDDAGLTRTLGRILPGDVRVVRVTTVAPEFHSRHDARSKTYTYRLDRSRAGDPFLARFALHHPFPMDRDALAEALAALPGSRDWTGFAGAACDVQDRTRELTEAAYDERNGLEGLFTFTADGFLNYMVRNLVGTLLDVARGRFPPARIAEVLRSGDRRQAGPTAPARGLCLERVRYDGPARPPAAARSRGARPRGR